MALEEYKDIFKVLKEHLPEALVAGVILVTATWTAAATVHKGQIDALKEQVNSLKTRTDSSKGQSEVLRAQISLQNERIEFLLDKLKYPRVATVGGYGSEALGGGGPEAGGEGSGEGGSQSRGKDGGEGQGGGSGGGQGGGSGGGGRGVGSGTGEGHGGGGGELGSAGSPGGEEGPSLRSYEAVGCPEIADSDMVTRSDIRCLAEFYDLMKVWPVNRHLQFKESDIAYWVEQNLSEEEIEIEFESRLLALRRAENTGKRISTQRDLSTLAQEIQQILGDR